MSNQRSAISGQQSAITDQRLKIQVGADKGNGLVWADLQGVPAFGSVVDAQDYLATHGGEQLQRDGLSFRIMPWEYPCKYVAFWEGLVQHG